MNICKTRAYDQLVNETSLFSEKSAVPPVQLVKIIDRVMNDNQFLTVLGKLSNDKQIRNLVQHEIRWACAENAFDTHVQNQVEVWVRSRNMLTKLFPRPQFCKFWFVDITVSNCLGAESKRVFKILK